MSADVSFSTIQPGLMADPYPVYDRLRQTTPVHWDAQENAWLLSRYGDVAAVMADPGFLVVELAAVVDGVSRRAGKDVDELRGILEAVLFLRNPPEHGEARGFLLAVMNDRPIGTYAAMIEEVADALLARATARAVFDAVRAYADLLPPLFMGRLLGLSDDAVAALVATVSEVTMTMDRGRSPRFYERVDRTVRIARATLSAEIAARRVRPRADGLSRMIELSDGRFHLSDGEIAARALFLLIAGIETTSALIGNAIKAVLEEPEASRRLARDPRLLEGAIEEVVRFDSPAQQTTRIAVHDTVIAGQAIRAGDRVVLLIGAAHRDPEAYDEPHRFNVTRKGLPHLGFGKGLHHCLGARLARLEAAIGVSKLLALRPEPAPAAVQAWWPHRTLRRLKSYPVRLGASPHIEEASASG